MMSALRVWAGVLAVLFSLSLVFYFGQHVQHTADIWLIVWWVSLIVLAVLAVLFRNQPQIPPPKVPASIWSAPPSMLAAGALLLVFIIGFFAFLWMSDSTWLLFLNARFCLVLLMLPALVAFSSRGMTAIQASGGKMSGWPTWQIRGVCFLGGLFVVWMGWQELNDLLRARQPVEGTVTAVSEGFGRGFMPQYRVVIDGKEYRALWSAFRAVEPGDRIRAEMSAGSNYVISTGRLD
jgi:hypothetical protein